MSALLSPAAVGLSAAIVALFCAGAAFAQILL